MEADVIYKYFPDLTQLQRDQLEKLGPLYEEWNQKINVISRKDIDTLYIRHLLHSLSIAKFIDFKDGSQLLDVGTGGGFPGIPLAILYPSVSFTLVDSIGKKIKVVQAVADACGLSNVSAIHQRAENASGKYDFVVTRAVARSRMIWNWTKHKLHSKHQHGIKNGIIALKGGDLTEELKELGRPCTRTPIPSYFEESFFETKEIIYIPIS